MRKDPDYRPGINSELTHELRIQLLCILYKRREAFARSFSESMTYNKQEFEIKMQNTKLMFNRQYKHKPEHGRILQQHINQWKAEKVVEPTHNFRSTAVYVWCLDPLSRMLLTVTTAQSLIFGI